MPDWDQLIASIAPVYDPSVSIKVVEAAKKYAKLGSDKPPSAVPIFTVPGDDHTYSCMPNERSWTYGFLPGCLWLLLEQRTALKVDIPYEPEVLVSVARRYQAGFRHLTMPAENHDQGFRFQLSFGYDMALTGDAAARDVLIEAADSLVDRSNDKTGCIRSWDFIVAPTPGYERLNASKADEHFITIIDTMMNLDLLYQVSVMTGDDKYARLATRQAEQCMRNHIRPNFTTYHVVNYDARTGQVDGRFTWQGYADESTWSRGQAWAVYGFAQCAIRTGRKDFLETSAKLADVFFDRLGEDKVPAWDFDCPKPTAWDASAACVAARGSLMLYELLLPSDKTRAEKYLESGFHLIANVLATCLTPKASLKDGVMDWGAEGWETVLCHSSTAGNPICGWAMLDHGLVFADYYLLEFANHALKLRNKYAAAS